MKYGPLPLIMVLSLLGFLLSANTRKASFAYRYSPLFVGATLINVRLFFSPGSFWLIVACVEFVYLVVLFVRMRQSGRHAE
jgi:hypothetical protein